MAKSNNSSNSWYRTSSWNGASLPNQPTSCSKITSSPKLSITDSVLRTVWNQKEKPRLIPRNRGRINVRSVSAPAYKQYIFFLICDLPWLQLFIVTTLMLLFFISLFALLFNMVGGITEIEGEKEASFWTFFFFSFQTMDQIGYGQHSPLTFECDMIVLLTTLLANFFWKFSGGIIFTKLSLPKKLKYINKFSDVAVRNWTQLTFQKNGYQHGTESLIFRIAVGFTNSSICDSDFHLIYFRTKTDENGWETFELTECEFEINRQWGRNRSMNFSRPLPGLPWAVVHPINKTSPLYQLTREQIELENGELIAILDGIDEISSFNYQSRWSYKASEILEGQEFVSCVRRDKATGFFVVDFDRLSKTRPAHFPSPAYLSIVSRKLKLTQFEKMYNTTKEERKQRFSRTNSLNSTSSDYTPRSPLPFSNTSSAGKFKTLSYVNLKFPVFVKKKPLENVEFLGEKVNIGKVPSLSADTIDNAETRDKEKGKFLMEKSFGK